METTLKKDGQVQATKAIAANTESNISYVVNFTKIGTDENGKNKILAVKELPYKDKGGLKSRSRAFITALIAIVNSCLHMKMDEEKFDSILSAQLKPTKDGTSISVRIDCINEATGERITINSGNILNKPDEHIEALTKELDWYKKNGYNTNGKSITETYRDKQYEILDYELTNYIRA